MSAVRIAAAALLLSPLSCSSSSYAPASEAGADTKVGSDGDPWFKTDTGGRDGSIADTSVIDSAADTSAPADVASDAPPRTVSLQAVQDRSDPGHPVLNEKIDLSDTDLVALTPRMLIGSASATDCRFAVWIGRAGGGAYAGVQVQELVKRGTATNCFTAPPGKISSVVMPGDTVNAVESVSYGEFCAGPSGTPATACANWEQTQLFLGAADAKITFGAPSSTPTGTNSPVVDLVSDAAGAPGTQALELEGTLVRVSNIRVLQEPSGSFTATLVVDGSDPSGSRKLEILISNFVTTSCVRSWFAGRAGTVIPSITGILLPDFGRWKLRIRDHKDVTGVTCATDGGV